MTALNIPPLATHDEINDAIWLHHGTNNTSAIRKLNPRKFDLQLIQNEISTGCSPVPDTLSDGFGSRPSVMFISTVYGFVHKYLDIIFDRQHESWQDFSNLFYQDIVRSNVGIYGRLNDIYDLVSMFNGRPLDFCFTELVKTVLISPSNTVSNLDTGDNFLRYFLKHEFSFLKRRLSMINYHCVVFTFTDIATFFTVAALSDLDVYKALQLPEQVQLVHQATAVPLSFETQFNRRGKMQILFEAGGTFSSSVALHTVFKTRDKDIYIIPLPHPSGANNGVWAQLGNWKETLTRLLQYVHE